MTARAGGGVSAASAVAAGRVPMSDGPALVAAVILRTAAAIRSRAHP